MGLDPEQRREFCLGFLGKAGKSLANEILQRPSSVSGDKFGFLNVDADFPLSCCPSWEMSKALLLRSNSDANPQISQSSSMPQYLVKMLNRLLVVKEISSIQQACRLNKVETETLFFSRLDTAVSVSDYIMRKLRGLVMVVSIDYISHELLEDEKLKTDPNKNEEKKLNMACQKRKKKSRNAKQLCPLPNPPRVNSTFPEPTKHNESTIDGITNGSCMSCYQEDNCSVKANQKALTSSACVMTNEPKKENVNCKGPGDRKRNGGKRARRKNYEKVVQPESEKEKTLVPAIAAESKVTKSVAAADISVVLPVPGDCAIKDTLLPVFSYSGILQENGIVGGKEMAKSVQAGNEFHFTDIASTSVGCNSTSGTAEDIKLASLAKDENNSGIISDCPAISCFSTASRQQVDDTLNCSGLASISSSTCLTEIRSAATDNECVVRNSRSVNGNLSQFVPTRLIHTVMDEESAVTKIDGREHYGYNHTNSTGGTSYEWPNTTPAHLTSTSSAHLPPATDILHLEVGHRLPSHFRQSFLASRHQNANPSVEGGHGRILPSINLPMSYDWPPVVKTCGRLSQTVAFSYDSAFSPALPPSFCSGFAPHAAHGVQINGAAIENVRKHSGDISDVYDMKTTSDLPEDTESYWLSEEETESHAFSGRDYNQFFGGGVMYWNPAEHVGTGFSRPPSHSSEDSSWALYEADLNRTIDDMVGLPGLPTSFNTNGLASPPAASFCSPFDPLGPGHHPVGYVVPGNDGGKILQSSSLLDGPDERPTIPLNSTSTSAEGVKGDPLPYPRLRPIIIPSISRKGSRSEFKLNHDHKSPCLPSARRDHTRIKRPPSPVVLCVPRVPRPPPPSPVGESRKRGFPIVRSGSSSPRHWGMRNCYHDDGTTEDPRLCLDGAEVVWPSWGTKGLAGNPATQSLQGSLLQEHLITISQLACDQEHPDVGLPLQPPDLSNCPNKASISVMHNRLHEEIDSFCKQVAAENLIKKPYVNWAVKRVTRSLQVLWPRSRTNIFGSNATGLALPTSDVDVVVSLPPVRNLEPIKEAGILEGRNGIKETCLQHAARYLANQDWVRNDSLKSIENTAIPVIMLVAQVPEDINYSNENSSTVEVRDAQAAKISGNAFYSYNSSSEGSSLTLCSKMRKDSGIDVKSVRLDISFKSPSHTGLQTSQLVRELTQQFPATVPLALVLKKFLADRSLDHSYSGGLSSYCLVLLITRFLQHEHHIGRSINQDLGGLLMDFLYFFGNVFDPRQMRISIQGSGVYMKRERGLSIDPIHIDDPLFPSNNVGRNCFRIHQCIKAFADAYSVLESELSEFSGDCGLNSTTSFDLLRKIIPSIDQD